MPCSFCPSIAILQISEIFLLFFTEANAKIVTEERGLPDVVNAMSTHPNNADLIETAAAALLSLSMEGKWGRCSICSICTARILDLHIIVSNYI